NWGAVHLPVPFSINSITTVLLLFQRYNSIGNLPKSDTNDNTNTSTDCSIDPASIKESLISTAS
ncbi:hypothetical protein P4562_15435, partial [Lysinibacillus xylanilyticus]|uniref:hypothetical protein n=1 Tax=Lysinibacillus xylanilyticus TaxID=582475 RepID=UPI002E2157ED|nr:hypothetical protein [Lysinibacillus xylanilyticus]